MEKKKEKKRGSEGPVTNRMREIYYGRGQKHQGILFDRCISGIPYFPFPKWERFSPANRIAILRDLKIKIKEEGEEIVCFVENVRIC